MVPASEVRPLAQTGLAQRDSQFNQPRVRGERRTRGATRLPCPSVFFLCVLRRGGRQLLACSRPRMKVRSWGAASLRKKEGASGHCRRHENYQAADAGPKANPGGDNGRRALRCGRSHLRSRRACAALAAVLAQLSQTYRRRKPLINRPKTGRPFVRRRKATVESPPERKDSNAALRVTGTVAAPRVPFRSLTHSACQRTASRLPPKNGRQPQAHPFSQTTASARLGHLQPPLKSGRFTAISCGQARCDTREKKKFRNFFWPTRVTSSGATRYMGDSTPRTRTGRVRTDHLTGGVYAEHIRSNNQTTHRRLVA